MRLVIDASAALKWVLQEPESDAAAALRDEDLIAPSLWLVEAANALWRHARLGQITTDETLEYYAALLNAPVTSLPIEPYVDAALRLASEIAHPIYDCLYLAVALHFGIDAVTANRRFVAAVDRSSHAGRVKLLGSA